MRIKVGEESQIQPFIELIHRQGTCLDVEREAKVSAREAPSATGRSCATTSRASPSPPSVVSLAVRMPIYIVYNMKVQHH